jgi:hypothetical protein
LKFQIASKLVVVSPRTKFVLVAGGVMVNVTRMKRIFTLIALVGLAAGVFAGCEQGGTDASSATNAPPAASTNK